jgi:hypothetical protein
MPLSDFDPLLGCLAMGFGEPAIVVRRGINARDHVIEGRFAVDPFDVSQAPDPSALNVTQIWFYYDHRSWYQRRELPQGVAAPVLHDLLIIREQEFEIVKIDKDDLGEHALQLLRVVP